MAHMIDQPLPPEKRSEGFRPEDTNGFHIGKAEDEPGKFRRWVETQCKAGKQITLDTSTMCYKAVSVGGFVSQAAAADDDGMVVIPMSMLPKSRMSFEALGPEWRVRALNSLVAQVLARGRSLGIGGAIAEKVDQAFADHGSTSMEDLDPEEYVDCYNRMRVTIVGALRSRPRKTKSNGMKTPSGKLSYPHLRRPGSGTSPATSSDDDDDEDEDEDDV